MHFRSLFVLLLVGCLAFATSAAANSITYILDVDPTGSYQVFGAASGDNFGIAQFAIELLDVDTIVNESPNVGFSPDIGGPIGFNFTRTGANVNPLGGAQDTSNPAANFVLGVGRTPGDLDPNGTGFNVVNPQFGQAPLMTDLGTFDSPVLLGSGTFTPEATPSFGQVSGLVFTTSDPVGGQPGIVAAPGDGIQLAITQEGGGGEPPVGVDAALSAIVNDVVMHQFEATDPDGDPNCAGCTWSNLVVDIGSPNIDPTLDPDGKFTWDTFGSPRGDTANPLQYKFTATVTDPDGNSGSAMLTVDLIPEPTALALMGLAVVGLGFIRRR